MDHGGSSILGGHDETLRVVILSNPFAHGAGRNRDQSDPVDTVYLGERGRWCLRNGRQLDTMRDLSQRLKMDDLNGREKQG